MVILWKEEGDKLLLEKGEEKIQNKFNAAQGREIYF